MNEEYMGRGQQGSPLHPSSPEASGRFWGLKAEAPEGPRPPPSRPGGGAAARGGAGGTGRPDPAPLTQLTGETTAKGARGLFRDPRGLLTAHGAARRASYSARNFPPGLSSNPVLTPGAESPQSPTQSHLAMPTTPHPCPPRAQARLRSGRHTGDEWGAAEVSGAVTPGLSRAWSPAQRQGAGARGALSRAHPRPPPAVGGAPPGPARSRGGTRAAVRPPGSAPAPPPPGHCARRHLHPPPRPPTPRPAGPVARPRPAAPRRPSSYEYVKRLYCPLPLPRPRGPAADPLGHGDRGEEAAAAAAGEEEGRCRRAGGRAGGGVGRGRRWAVDRSPLCPLPSPSAWRLRPSFPLRSAPGGGSVLPGPPSPHR
ncbi:translation initiation factor IF-2-like [Elephas maximus indicus]|uniref:translation initiation factor IF-2-like n=1 Tax=Elephas maximus indicus TaxID=99487 RepID=UPI002116DE80|nr:translation initiation factor IF-2-like [Elephas maximus indicus]